MNASQHKMCIPQRACLSDEELAAGISQALSPAELTSCLAHAETCTACMALLHTVRDDTVATVVPFGRYELFESLGSGGMGVVFRGRDTTLHREVAIKLLNHARSDDAGRAQTLREARALAAVQHANVVKVHDVGEIDGEMYIAMEYAAGLPLPQWWAPRSAVVRCKVLAQVAHGLHAMHSAGLLHRDIKPANIVVNPRDEAVIVDLGLATRGATSEALAMGSPAAGAVVAGTDGYLAPELLEGAPASVASDEFAFWRVVAQTMQDVPLSHRRRRRLSAAVARGTAADPAARFGSLRTAATTLLSAVAPTEARWFLAGAVGTALAAALLVLWLWQPWQQAAVCNTSLLGWSNAQRDAVVTQVTAAGIDARKLRTFIDDEYAAGMLIGKAACRQVTSADPSTRSLGLRQQLCVAQTWRRITTNLAALHAPGAVGAGLDAFTAELPMASCQRATPPSTPASAPPAMQQRVDALFAQLDEPGLSAARVDALGGDIAALSYGPLTATWHALRARQLAALGNLAAAAAAQQQAARFAQSTSDDLRFAIARVGLLTLEVAQGHDISGLEPDVQAVVERIGSPGLMAEFQIAVASDRYRRSQLAPAHELLTQAITTLERIALAPHERLLAAYQNLAAVLQLQRDLPAAATALDHAVQIATARLGADASETLHVRLARAMNMIYAGASDAAVSEIEAIEGGVRRLHLEATVLGYDVALGHCQLTLSRRSNDRDAVCAAAVDVGAKVYGVNARELVTPLIQLGQAQLATSVATAMPTLERALQLAGDGSATANPTDVPYVQALLALAYQHTGKHAEARKLAIAALPLLRKYGQTALAENVTRSIPGLPAQE